MYEYNQFVYFRAAVLIPALSEADFASFVRQDDTWRNKWLYLRVSADYPIIFHAIQRGEGDDMLFYDEEKNKFFAAYDGDIKDPNFIDPLEHIIWPIPGMTIGVEFQFLDFMSAETNLQISFGDTRNNFFVNLALGTELKFPIKLFKNYAIAPYATFVFPLRFSEWFPKELNPRFYLGGGVQLNINGGKLGAFFVDVKFTMPTSQIVMNNYTAPFSKKPDHLYYRRFSLGVSAGYKFGFFHRN
jgi:hypothetical protein